MKTLQQLIKSLNLNYVNSDITSEHFPDIGRSQEIDTVQYDKYMTTEEVIADMKKTGHEPANAHELLEWAKNWNGKDWVMALGQTWTDARGIPWALDLWGNGVSREVGLISCIPRDRWRQFCLFARRKSLGNSESKTLESFNPLAFKFSYNGEEFKIVKV